MRKCLIFFVRLSSGRAMRILLTDQFLQKNKRERIRISFNSFTSISSSLLWKGDNNGARLVSTYSPDLPGQSVQMVESGEK